ncbi:MAG: hypothetical protein QNJ70_14260 [Xenococcaceae cyanobacterium MO_207.B15]|nr:hypothetical protein [Xenococcaceae cyanobacterium MO_207.B15]
MSQINHSSDLINNSTSPIATDRKHIFKLIDSIVSLEFCLHYQFLPLALRDNVLILGMINPEDRNGYNFIYPIVKALGYSLEIFELDSQTHQLILASYLKRDFKEVSNSNPDTLPSSLQSNLLQNAGKQSSASELDYSLTLTDIPATPPNLEETPPPKSSTSELDYSLTLTDVPATPPNNSKTPNLHERPTLIVNTREKLPPDSSSLEDAISISQPEIFASEPNITSSNLPQLNSNNLESLPNLLEVKAKYINESIDTLSSLAPEQLWQELLARILDGGIGRLYLERHSDYGRIIWSRDGVLQSSLEPVEIAIFNHIIQEIKILAKQPLKPIEKSKKVATEKFYNQERILLRIEFFLNKYGEEITIQILRGKALKFYEQRQVKRMMEQALSLSQKLDKILKKIIFCSRSGELDELDSLIAIFEQIEKQIKLLEKQAKNPQG